MKICLRTHAKQDRRAPVRVSIHDRLPVFVKSPCELACDFQVEAHRDYYLLTLDVQGMLELTCQRCLGDFQYDYHNQSKLAVCRSEEVAEKLMASYECIVSEEGEVDLVEIITDELHLYCPEKHSELMACDVLIHQYAG